MEFIELIAYIAGKIIIDARVLIFTLAISIGTALLFGLLHAMHIQLLSGRGLNATDSAGKPAVALVNQAFVKQIASGGKVLGKTVTVSLASSDGPTVAEIVGVVEDVADYQGQFSFQPQIYFFLAQYPSARFVVVARTSVDAASLTLPIRQAIRSNDPIETARPN